MKPELSREQYREAGVLKATEIASALGKKMPSLLSDGVTWRIDLPAGSAIHVFADQINCFDGEANFKMSGYEMFPTGGESEGVTFEVSGKSRTQRLHVGVTGAIKYESTPLVGANSGNQSS